MGSGVRMSQRRHDVQACPQGPPAVIGVTILWHRLGLPPGFWRAAECSVSSPVLRLAGPSAPQHPVGFAHPCPSSSATSCLSNAGRNWTCF